MLLVGKREQIIGYVQPKLAVFRLISSSNLIGRSTGRSSGFTLTD
jgi:hypothetical protein